MKVMSVVGARPQFVKLAALAEAFSHTQHQHVIVHTGQHYDADLSDAFFQGLSIPDPDVHLGAGSGTHGVQTGTILAALDPVIGAARPDWVVVYGDTNSTLAGALSAVKQQFPVAHLEAGLRAFNRRMPEEHNRVLTDHAADLLLAPTDGAIKHLTDEGLAHRAVLTGDVMVDVCLRLRDRVLRGEAVVPAFPASLDLRKPYLFATLHRAENTDDSGRLAALVNALAGLPVPVVLAAHPRLLARAASFGIKLEHGSVRVSRPLPYAELVASVLESCGVITDSGGLQKEAFLLQRVCTTLRAETEWPETLRGGWNALVPDPRELGSRAWSDTVLRPAPKASRHMPYGDGEAATRVVRALEHRLFR
ncbi:non-hydrolyzing UDP-N-acetylglucosamine 2-epimerase [Streptomyces sp. NPDC086787]|uniref:non-hydrolyzing UDP-N-acetylglucosamine 2-epimerase n=1 Tax=Streptomyces sp. NPDC086787 TaxID=3365759 RepID=UPI00380E3DE2